MFAALLTRIAAALDAAGLPAIVIGGQAVLLHGEPRFTRDIDITLGVDTDQLDTVVGLVRRAFRGGLRQVHPRSLDTAPKDS